MLKQTLTFVDFDDQPQTQDLYFNVAKSELVDLLPLLPVLEEWMKKTGGDDRTLTTQETLELLDIIKRIVKLSYGKKEGSLFRKSPEIFADFKDSAAYDAFLMEMFSDLEKANNFMINVLPKDMREFSEAAAPAGQAIQSVPLPEGSTSVGGEMTTTVEEVPAWIREDRDPTQQEFSKMTQEQLQQAFQAKSARMSKQA